MKISVEINSCSDCRHLDHSGSYTPGGAKSICGHDKSAYWAWDGKTHKEATGCKYNCGDAAGNGCQCDYWNWMHRVIPINPIPNWCPLKHREKY